jgi:DNA-binding MarR family transcriptional regulator
MTLDLGDYLPYLLNRAGTRIAGAFSAVVRDYGVTLPMWRVLAALNDRGEGMRIGHLSECTSIEISTLSRVVDGLERKGLVRRRRSADDARAVRVEPTAAGTALTARIVPVARHYEDAALAGFSEAEARQIKALLVRLYDNMAALESEQREGRREAG